MTLVINILIDILNEGLMYALLAMGMYITYSILELPGSVCQTARSH